MTTILITGGSGHIASAIRPLLGHYRCRLTDLVAPEDALGVDEEFVAADITDLDAMTAACAGANLVVHLGGHRQERPFDEILRVNIGGTRAVLEGARRAGVRRVLLASSGHAVGYATVADARREPVLDPRPDSYYGVGKVALEALGSLYADRFGMTVVSARIAAFLPEPLDRRGLSLWFSPADMVRLVDACAVLEGPGHRIVWGVSDNTRAWVRGDAGAAIGFRPVDDAERHADGIPGIMLPGLEDEAQIAATALGGTSVTADRELGTDWG
ncbi:NAD(P)-dependent oxidoreductase [Microbacterium pseudoresistens]|uniref:Nucleoside-diphosphate-sugar epimerase n=1 Tax=Microbacterium pseudoresistens TaxID=640634 RepID=A0A7Y9ESV7_9MICO|nr:NAD(P)-dependent oxidoreductase [Microbacterium pseudoresistens]NYD53337.1 nucleoside-diphosphate-sugar epimerase [Microbacterium pseudoresistens]